MKNIIYSFTIFESQYDNKTDKQMTLKTWDEFEGLLYNLALQPYATKKQARLISPASYREDTTRSNDAVVDWGGWAALDIDKHDFDSSKLEKELYDRYGDYYYVCYSTASSSIDNPKFRLVFPLTRRVEADEIKRLWYGLNKEFNELGDAQTKDLSRMYYVPGNYSGSNNFIFTNHGSHVDPSVIINKHPMPEKKVATIYDHLPPAMRDMMMNYKKTQLTNTNITWNSYKDCPFVNKKMLDDYMRIAYVDGTGRYAAFYQLMVSIASRAVKMGYPITEHDIIDVVRGIDMDTTNRYKKRRLDVEAKNALECAMQGI